MSAFLRGVGGAWILALLVASGASAEEPKVRELVQGPEDAAPAEATAEKGAAPAPAPGPPDDFDRGVPRTSVAGFLAAAEEGDWERAAEYLDTRRLPRGYTTDDGPELARQLAFNHVQVGATDSAARDL